MGVIYIAWQLGSSACFTCLSVFRTLEKSVFFSILLRLLTFLIFQGSLSLWDIPRGSLLRRVVFPDSEQRGFVNHVVSVGNSGVVCDQGKDLKVVYFPTILEKAE